MLSMDIFNNSYDAALGPLPEHHSLPVVSVYFGNVAVPARVYVIASTRRLDWLTMLKARTGCHRYLTTVSKKPQCAD